MRKAIYIYDNSRRGTGVFASENLVQSYEGGDCEKIIVEIPDRLEPYEAICGGTMVKLGEYSYPFNECLRVDKNDHPYLMAIEPGTYPIRLKVIERVGRKSLSFTL